MLDSPLSHLSACFRKSTCFLIFVVSRAVQQSVFFFRRCFSSSSCSSKGSSYPPAISSSSRFPVRTPSGPSIRSARYCCDRRSPSNTAPPATTPASSFVSNSSSVFPSSLPSCFRYSSSLAFSGCLPPDTFASISRHPRCLSYSCRSYPADAPAPPPSASSCVRADLPLSASFRSVAASPVLRSPAASLDSSPRATTPCVPEDSFRCTYTSCRDEENRRRRRSDVCSWMPLLLSVFSRGMCYARLLFWCISRSSSSNSKGRRFPFFPRDKHVSLQKEARGPCRVLNALFLACVLVNLLVPRTFAGTSPADSRRCATSALFLPSPPLSPALHFSPCRPSATFPVLVLTAAAGAAVVEPSPAAAAVPDATAGIAAATAAAEAPPIAYAAAEAAAVLPQTSHLSPLSLLFHAVESPADSFLTPPIFSAETALLPLPSSASSSADKFYSLHSPSPVFPAPSSPSISPSSVSFSCSLPFCASSASSSSSRAVPLPPESPASLSSCRLLPLRPAVASSSSSCSSCPPSSASPLPSSPSPVFFFSAPPSSPRPSSSPPASASPPPSPPPSSQQQPPFVPDTQLQNFFDLATGVRDRGMGSDWEPLTPESSPVAIWRRSPAGSSAQEYVASGTFEDISVAAFNTTLNSLPVRLLWDTSIVKLQSLSVYPVQQQQGEGDKPAAARLEDNRQQSQKGVSASSASSRSSAARHASSPANISAAASVARPGTAAGDGRGPPRDSGPVEEQKSSREGERSSVEGGEEEEEDGKRKDREEYEEIVYWRMKLPWPLQDRDFVYARRFRTYTGEAVVGVQQAMPPSFFPEQPRAVRVDHFLSAVVLFPANDARSAVENGVFFVLYHFDGSKTPVPPWLRSYFAATTLPNLVAALRGAATALARPDGTLKTEPPLQRQEQQPQKSKQKEKKEGIHGEKSRRRDKKVQHGGKGRLSAEKAGKGAAAASAASARQAGEPQHHQQQRGGSAREDGVPERHGVPAGGKARKKEGLGEEATTTGTAAAAKERRLDTSSSSSRHAVEQRAASLEPPAADGAPSSVGISAAGDGRQQQRSNSSRPTAREAAVDACVNELATLARHRKYRPVQHPKWWNPPAAPQPCSEDRRSRSSSSDLSRRSSTTGGQLGAASLCSSVATTIRAAAARACRNSASLVRSFVSGGASHTQAGTVGKARSRINARNDSRARGGGSQRSSQLLSFLVAEEPSCRRAPASHFSVLSGGDRDIADVDKATERALAAVSCPAFRASQALHVLLQAQEEASFIHMSLRPSFRTPWWSLHRSCGRLPDRVSQVRSTSKQEDSESSSSSSSNNSSVPGSTNESSSRHSSRNSSGSQKSSCAITARSRETQRGDTDVSDYKTESSHSAERSSAAPAAPDSTSRCYVEEDTGGKGAPDHPLEQGTMARVRAAASAAAAAVRGAAEACLHYFEGGAWCDRGDASNQRDELQQQEPSHVCRRIAAEETEAERRALYAGVVSLRTYVVIEALLWALRLSDNGSSTKSGSEGQTQSHREQKQYHQHQQSVLPDVAAGWPPLIYAGSVARSLLDHSGLT